jgi:hypothetical protein
MTINRGFTANHKVYDRMTRLTPVVEKSESERLFSNATVAAWLPVSRQTEDVGAYVVISTGKAVALDNENHYVPAGLRKTWNTATSTTILTYAAADVTEKTTDLTTGVAVAAATSYTETQVTTALRERGLIRATERATDFISKPIGVASYDFLNAAGSDPNDPKTYRFNNHNPQAKQVCTADYILQYPLFPAIAETEATADRTSGAAGLMEDIFDGTTTRNSSATGFFSSTQIAEVTRYASEVSAGDDVVAFVTVNYPISANTAQTPMSTSTSSCLVNEVGSIGAIRAAGDYFVDEKMGVIFLYESGGDAVPSPWVAATTTITYYHYQTEGTGNTLSTFACVLGDVGPGDFLTYDDNSNLIKAVLDISAAEGYDSSEALYSADPDYDDAGEDAAISLQIEKAVQNYVEGIVGQVVGIETFPRGGLDKVATAFMGETAVNMQTPGTATSGRTDNLTYASASTKMVLVNLLK